MKLLYVFIMVCANLYAMNQLPYSSITKHEISNHITFTAFLANGNEYNVTLDKDLELYYGTFTAYPPRGTYDSLSVKSVFPNTVKKLSQEEAKKLFLDLQQKYPRLAIKA